MKARIALLALALLACTEKKVSETTTPSEESLTFKTEAAPEWTSLFTRSHGWFGGDGIYALPFSGNDSGPASDSVLFLFSDSMVGDIENGLLKPGYSMTNNSVMILHGKQPAAQAANFLYKTPGAERPESLFVPATPLTGKDDYYWLGDGFVNSDDHNDIAIFAYRIRNTNDGSPFPFRVTGNSLIVLAGGDPFPWKKQKQFDFPFYSENDSLTGLYGAAILNNTTTAGAAKADGFVYVYGIRGKNKELLAARVTPKQLTQFDAWQFYNGQTWTSDPKSAVPLAQQVSNELSISMLPDHSYGLVYQEAGLSSSIMLRTGPTPVGPFGPAKKLWDTSADTQVKDFYAYNAKAHPALSAPGELLVSYNVNSFNFFDHIVKTPYLYRPRFFRIIFSGAH